MSPDYNWFRSTVPLKRVSDTCFTLICPKTSGGFTKSYKMETISSVLFYTVINHLMFKSKVLFAPDLCHGVMIRHKLDDDMLDLRFYLQHSLFTKQFSFLVLVQDCTFYVVHTGLVQL